MWVAITTLRALHIFLENPVSGLKEVARVNVCTKRLREWMYVQKVKNISLI
jgi:hypothetical protein